MTDKMEKEIVIQLPPNGFGKTMFFNRLQIVREPNFCIANFGLVTSSGPIDSFSCCIHRLVLEQNKAILLPYFDKLSEASEIPLQWSPIGLPQHVGVVDVVTMSFRGVLAETCLYSFSMCATTRPSGNTDVNSGSILAQPLGLLRCSTGLQKTLITELYRE